MKIGFEILRVECTRKFRWIMESMNLLKKNIQYSLIAFFFIVLVHFIHKVSRHCTQVILPDFVKYLIKYLHPGRWAISHFEMHTWLKNELP